jgi:hypothetical protein
MTNSLKEIIKKLVIPRHPEIVGYDVTMHDFFGTTRYDVEIIIGLCFFDIKINKIRSDIEFLFNMLGPEKYEYVSVWFYDKK